MTEEIELILADTEEKMEAAIVHLKGALQKIRGGKASAGMLDGITVEYYGAQTVLNQTASLNTPDPKTILIQPFEKSMIKPIEKAIIQANLGFNPQNDGTNVIINVPPLTEERRKEIVKFIKQEGEQCKVSIRTIRKDANEMIKKEQKDGLSEDEAKTAEAKVQELTDKFNARIEKDLEVKEAEIMKV